jgi:protein-tyrosine phosphatase
MIDFHNHLVPGVDDGAADLDEARAALALFREQGVTEAVCTPHFSGAATRRPEELERALAALDAGWEALSGIAEAELPLHRGAEVMLDTPEPDLTDPRLRLAGTRFVLIEFPFMNVPPGAAEALFALKMAGWHPVLAHPERYANARDDLADAAEWRRVGALLQVNGGSLLGRYGPRAEKLAWGLLGAGAADYLSSDYHARGGCHAGPARDALEERGAAEQAALLTEENPRRLLRGEAPLPVPPVRGRRPSLLWRILRRRG